MSACLLDNEVLKQELHLCDKSKIHLYFERFEFLANLSKSPLCDSTLFLNFNVPGRSPLHGISLCISMPSWDWTSVWRCPCVPVSVELTDYPGLDALRLREVDPTPLPFLCTMTHASMQRRRQMSLPVSCVRLLLHKAAQKLAAQAEDQRDVQRKLEFCFIMRWPFLPFSKIWQLSSPRAKKH